LKAYDVGQLFNYPRHREKDGNASLAFFYCDLNEKQKKELRGLVSSLLVQFCHQSDSYCDILSDLYLEHANGTKHAGDDGTA
jgi:hypothetical protein